MLQGQLTVSAKLASVRRTGWFRRVYGGTITIFIMFVLSRGAQAQYIIGADVSFTSQAVANGSVYKDQGKAEPPLQILKDHGYNWIRLRLFVHPTNLPNNLSYTIASAQAAKKLGFKFLLDLHYSDTWADPGKQTIPKAWQDETHAQLVKTVFRYTRDTIKAFREAGALPDMVQIGNEVINGMLWPDGKLPQNWDNFADLLKAGINGVDAGYGNEQRPKIMIHIACGGDKARTKYFFDNIISREVPFDVIGQSYYPWWHGSLDDLRENLYFMATEYHKDIILVEVAYCWRPTEYMIHAGPFPETPEGQRRFLRTVYQSILQAPDNLGKGFFWWEPVVPETSSLRARGLFDDSGGNALPAIKVFDEFTRR
jgi:arabinogalactan endo-1,4-beta-galactosidase